MENNMGGMVTIAARYKNGEVIKFKTSTNFFDYQMNSPHLINEEYFKQQVLENELLRDKDLAEEEFRNYDSRKAILAPYEYGIILLDYANNTFLSCNDYNALITGSSEKLLDEYKRLVKSDFIISITDHSTKSTKKVDARENRFLTYQEIHLIHMALKNGATIKCKDVEIKHSGTIESVVSSIYGISIENKLVDEQLAIIKLYEEDEAKKNNETYGNPYRFSIEDYSDITFEYPGFKLVECDNDNEHGIIYQYLQDNSFKLTEYEHETWKKYIAARLERYEAEMDREIDIS
jgi:hypothetical protein